MGHAIHAGILFLSSSYWSILLGEQVALAVLRDRAKSYNEPFSVSIKKFDETTARMTNKYFLSFSHEFTRMTRIREKFLIRIFLRSYRNRLRAAAIGSL